MKVILDFVTNSSEGDYYDCDDCKNCNCKNCNCRDCVCQNCVCTNCKK